MQREEIIGFIRDQMLTSPYIDAGLTYKVAHLAETEDFIYDIMNQWMDAIEDSEKVRLECIMEQAIDDVGNYGRFV